MSERCKLYRSDSIDFVGKLLSTTSHVGIDGNEKANFLARTAAEAEVSPIGSGNYLPLRRLKSIVLEELFLVTLGTSEEVQELHLNLYLGNTRLPSHSL
ncbi:hypothetical protein TNCV_3670351 [Trichonephila clavipes]|nr:hypothetical protein TNCV_3670351 [Trichonephila clavipes]